MALIDTIHGSMEEALLEKRTGGSENALQRERWVEYWFGGVLVHRSAQVDLKQGLGMGLEQGLFGR